MLIDTHAHINFNAFGDDADEVLQRAFENDIWMIMPGSQYTTSKRAVEIAEQYEEGVYAAVGIHPIHLDKRRVDVQEVQSTEEPEQPWMLFDTRAEDFDYEKYKELAQSKKVVAIGEVGLDYYYQPKGKAKREEYRSRQKEILTKQIDLAKELDLPVILHCRVAHNDLYEMLNTPLRGVMHSYTGTVEQAKKFMEFGLYIGFNGLIFKDVATLPNPEEVISSIPLEKILLETDSPYLVPPMADKERNEPAFVKYIAEEIARIKKINVEEIGKVTTENARALFQLK